MFWQAMPERPNFVRASFGPPLLNFLGRRGVTIRAGPKSSVALAATYVDERVRSMLFALQGCILRVFNIVSEAPCLRATYTVGKPPQNTGIKKKCLRKLVPFSTALHVNICFYSNSK